ncbi:hypothetical protein PENVUL_c001G05676 [Penicillium vulpinum]|uniref:CENP-V/GFA domain-containing protein n=1 Tax=Penicillium vulpinum TaxID=29845 RepID=A0A1V6SFF5_9EURO|nr:hypothetical protein PENVUL_c001G05676 [Penicillium vulpinum]
MTEMNDTGMSSPEFYQGNCHCGQIRFDLNLQQPLRRASTCCCSICSKKGYLWIFLEESQFRIKSGQQAMARYTANGRSGEHFFCPSCGTGIMAKNHMAQGGGSDIVVNARALFGVNPFTLEVEA